jgi:single-strand DNA-binding protein
VDRNEVILVGRLAGGAEKKAMPSGSTLTIWRVIVRRPARRRGGHVDTIKCVTFDAEVSAVVTRWSPGDVVEVVGALRRRFFGKGDGKSNSYEVEARTVRLLERPSVPPKGTAVATGSVPPPARAFQATPVSVAPSEAAAAPVLAAVPMVTSDAASASVVSSDAVPVSEDPRVVAAKSAPTALPDVVSASVPPAGALPQGALPPAAITALPAAPHPRSTPVGPADPDDTDVPRRDTGPFRWGVRRPLGALVARARPVARRG